MERIYIQCDLYKDNRHDKAWIPKKYAIVGKTLRIRGEDGWIITKIYRELLFSTLMKDSRDYRYQRKASDI